MPPLLKDDNVLPSASEIPALLSSISRPRRRRISVGPQSEADVREFLASREQRRNRSNSSPTRKLARSAAVPDLDRLDEKSVIASNEVASFTISRESTEKSTAKTSNSGHVGLPLPSPQVNAPKTDLLIPPLNDKAVSINRDEEDEKNDHAMFLALERPRTRYDVEVITKLVVYAGKLEEPT